MIFKEESSENKTFCNDEHSLNAFDSIIYTEEGIAIVLRDLH